MAEEVREIRNFNVISQYVCQASDWVWDLETEIIPLEETADIKQVHAFYVYRPLVMWTNNIEFIKSELDVVANNLQYQVRNAYEGRGKPKYCIKMSEVGENIQMIFTGRASVRCIMLYDVDMMTSYLMFTAAVCNSR